MSIRWMCLAIGLAAAPAAFGLTGCQPQASSNVYQVAVTDNGFEPAETKIPAGRPATIVFTRKTAQTCATEVVFAGLNQRYELPLNEPVRVELPANEGGTLAYACGMDMIKGTVEVQ